MDWEETKAFLSPCFPDELRQEMELLYPGELREVRIRADRPAVFCTAGRMAAMQWTPAQAEVEALAEALSGHGLYARTEETGQGFVTLRGGHRMGLCGRVHRQGDAYALREIGSVCVRIASEWPGCADPLVRLLTQTDGFGSMLIVGAPGTGKTTLLRDLSRQLAGGEHPRQAALIDERGELAACVNGVPQLDVGAWADVLDGCGKAHAVQWLVRSMAPQVLLTDELGGAEDAAAVEDAVACGVAVMASVHGTSLNDLAARPAMAALMARRCFRWYVVLHSAGDGRVAAVFDRSGSPVKLA